jgi:hypothetical protein
LVVTASLLYGLITCPRRITMNLQCSRNGGRPRAMANDKIEAATKLPTVARRRVRSL